MAGKNASLFMSQEKKILPEEKIKEIWQLITKKHSEHLSKYGVALPNLKVRRKGQIEFSKDALVLVYLAQGYPNTKWISKESLTAFIREYFPDTNDVQSARHLGMQKGFYIVSSRQGNNYPENKPPPSEKGTYYLLVSLEKPHPAFRPKRRQEVEVDFSAIKQGYQNRCATCGSEEGMPHLKYPQVTTRLQRGHRNPHLPLTPENTIPQCELCNRAYRNWWIFDERGRVEGIASAEPVLRSFEKGWIPEEEVKRIYAYIRGHYEWSNSEKSE